MLEILDFYADWCGPCIAMKPVMEELEKELKGKAKIRLIDVDKNQDEVSKYGIMSIPTYVVLKDRKEIDRFVGVIPKQKFLNIVETHSNLK